MINIIIDLKLSHSKFIRSYDKVKFGVFRYVYYYKDVACISIFGLVIILLFCNIFIIKNLLQYIFKKMGIKVLEIFT